MRTNLKTWALAGLVALGAAALATAQEPRRGHDGRQSVETRVNRMRESLNLSDDQAARIAAILNEAAAKPADGNREDRLTRRQNVRQRINEVLTPEQREKRDQIASERGKAGKGGRRGQRRGR